MAGSTKDIREAIATLVKEGEDLKQRDVQYWLADEDDREPTFDFSSEYHRWYSPALRTVKQLLPDRLEEFELYYRNPKAKDMSLSSYTIQDHISGVFMRAHPPMSWASQAIGKFASQIAIVRSAGD